MTEKNIIVNRGIPMTPSVAGVSAGRYNSFNPGAGSNNYGDEHHAGDDSFAFFAEWESRDLEMKTAFNQRIKGLPQAIEAELASVRLQNDMSPLPPVASITREVNIRKKLIEVKTAESIEQDKIANSFFGSDPLAKTLDDWAQLYNSGRDGITILKGWTASVSAAYTAKLIREGISILKAQSGELAKKLEIAELEEEIKTARDQVNRKEYPAAPEGVSLEENMQESKAQKEYFSTGGNAFLFSWFYKKVKNGGDWDYKQRSRQYASFGNFNYGAVGTAAGISEPVLLRAAGAAQTAAGTSKEQFDKWWSESPYGDDPVDQIWIKAGIDYAKSKGY